MIRCLQLHGSREKTFNQSVILHILMHALTRSNDMQEFSKTKIVKAKIANKFDDITYIIFIITRAVVDPPQIAVGAVEMLPIVHIRSQRPADLLEWEAIGRILLIATEVKDVGNVYPVVQRAKLA
mmetsp:Transcript_5110/g.5913  ORF Transcript_5110/g.5913 Transcript_5110/m.5913 type:complete len:125 (-) Transcript_5110:291-665(-)